MQERHSLQVASKRVNVDAWWSSSLAGSTHVALAFLSLKWPCISHSVPTQSVLLDSRDSVTLSQHSPTPSSTTSSLATRQLWGDTRSPLLHLLGNVSSNRTRKMSSIECAMLLIRWQGFTRGSHGHGDKKEALWCMSCRVNAPTW